MKSPYGVMRYLITLVTASSNMLKYTWGQSITNFSLTKQVIPEGQEPFSEYRPDENVEAFLSPLSIVTRMTTDVYNALYLGKALVELKNQVRDMYEE